jgi:Protein of unknown function (DUF3048) N-terminal domain/Protein of unknown function (DUF3048) C-terminal domain
MRLRPFPLRVCLLSAAVLLSACQPQTPPSPTPAPPPPTQTPLPTVAPTPTTQPTLAPTVAPTLVPTPTPAPVLNSLNLDANPFAVMIDNIAEARPQFGLGSADVVYEAPAEAGIPRLMPLFLRQGGEASRIGPVRSTRHYFVELANEYRTPLVHIGASPQGFEMLKETGLPDLDETRDDPGFTRDRNRAAPHNAFVSTESIRSALQQRGVQTDASSGPLKFVPTFQDGTQPATSLKINYPGGERYSVEYTYNPDTRLYPRIMDGQPHKDGATGEQYAARSILIQYVNVQAIPNDPALRVEVSLVGSGQGLLLVDGTQIPLTWKKSSIQEPTTFKREDGSAFNVPEGQVWVQLVPLEAQVAIT